MGHKRSNKDKLKTLEKRLRFLESKIEAEPFGRFSYERAEIGALTWAMPILWEHFVKEKEANAILHPPLQRQEV